MSRLGSKPRAWICRGVSVLLPAVACCQKPQQVRVRVTPPPETTAVTARSASWSEPLSFCPGARVRIGPLGKEGETYDGFVLDLSGGVRIEDLFPEAEQAQLERTTLSAKVLVLDVRHGPESRECRLVRGQTITATLYPVKSGG